MSVGQFLRKNPTLLIGILLPVVVIGLFVAATAIPRMLVDPPRHDFVFVIDQTFAAQPTGLRYEIDVDPDGVLRVMAEPVEAERYNPRPQLFLYEHGQDAVREIALPKPREELVGLTRLDVPELAGVRFDTSRRAPDGYEVIEPRRSSGDIFGLFYRGNRDSLAIGKSGAVVSVDVGDDLRGYGTRFLGWVVDE